MGGMLAARIGLPVPYLAGAALVSLLLALAGLGPARIPAGISFATRVSIGVIIGTTLDLSLTEQLPRLGLAAALVPVQVLLVLAAGNAVLRRSTNLNASERLLGALPGGFGSIVLSLDGLGHNARRISLFHALRVLLVVTLIPLVLAWGLAVDSTGLPADRSGALRVDPGAIAILLLLALGGALLARLLRFPGGSILLPLALTVLVNATLGLPELPWQAMPAAQTVLGALLGFRFADGGLRALGDSLGPGLLLAAVVLACALPPAVILYLVNDLPLGLGILAFAPGGVPEISILALSLGLDPELVVPIHVWRLLIVLAMLPFLLRRVERGEAADRRGKGS